MRKSICASPWWMDRETGVLLESGLAIPHIHVRTFNESVASIGRFKASLRPASKKAPLR